MTKRNEWVGTYWAASHWLQSEWVESNWIDAGWVETELSKTKKRGGKSDRGHKRRQDDEMVLMAFIHSWMHQHYTQRSNTWQTRNPQVNP